MKYRKILGRLFVFGFVGLGYLLVSIFMGGQPLSAKEILIAKSVFSESIDYKEVKIKSGGLLTWIYPGVTVGNTIAFPKKAYDEENLEDQALLIHELTHVWQFQHEGIRYLFQALYAEVFTDNPYVIHYEESKSFQDYDVEEQAEIAAEYYLTKEPKFETYIEEIQKYPIE